MIKRIRPPYLLIFLLLLVVILVITGAGFFLIRRSPDYYEGRGDRFAQEGDHLSASRQYAAAAEREKSKERIAGLLIKRAEALARTRRDTRQEAFKDVFQAAKSLGTAMRLAPAYYKAAEAFLDLQYRQTELINTPPAWATFADLLKDAGERTSDSAIVKKYKVITDFRRLCFDRAATTRDFRNVMLALEAELARQPADPDLQLSLRLVKIVIAERIDSWRPGKAYAFRNEAVTEPFRAGDGADDLRQSDCAVLNMIVDLLKEEETDEQTFAEIEIRLRTRLENLRSPRANLRAARTLLLVHSILPSAKLASPSSDARQIAMSILEELRWNRQEETTATYLLLLHRQGAGDVEGSLELLAADRERGEVAAGLLERSLDWLLTIASSRAKLKMIFERMHTEHDSHSRALSMDEAADEIAFLEEIEALRGDPSPYLACFKALADKFDLERRRALGQLLQADEMAEGSSAVIKLEIGSLLLELNESGAAAEWLLEAWQQRANLTVGDRIRAFRDLADAYLKSGQYGEAVKVARELDRIAADEPRLLAMTGSILRGVSSALTARSAKVAEELQVRAREVLEEAVRQDTENTAARMDLGLLYLQSGNARLAEKEFRRVIAAVPAHIPALRSLIALVRERPGGEDEARDLILSVRSQALTDGVATRVEQLLHENETDWNRFSAALRLLVPSPFGQRLALLEDLQRNRLDAEADRVFADLRRTDPNHEIVVGLHYEKLLAARDYVGIRELTDQVARPLILPSLSHEINGRLELTLRQPYTAIADFKSALRTDPLNSALYAALGRAQRLAMFHDDSVASLLKALEIRPGVPALLLELHRTLDAADSSREAAKVLRESVGQVGYNPELLATLLDYETAQGHALAVLGVREKLASQFPDDEENRRSLALLAFQTGDEDAAQKALRELVRSGREKARNVLALATVIEREKGPGPAVECIIENLGHNVTAVSWLDALAVAQRVERLGQAARAEPFLLHAVEASPVGAGRATAEAAHIRWLLRLDRNFEAKTRARELLQRPVLPVVFVEVGKAFLVDGHAADALELLESGPRTVETLSMMAQARFELGDTERGDDDFERAIASSPQDPRPHIWRAQTIIQHNIDRLLPKAELDLKRAASLQPKLDQPQVLLARLMQSRGRVEEADRLVAMLAQTWPEREEYRLWRCRLCLARGDLESAATTIKAAARQNMTSHEWGLLAGRLAIRRGQPGTAINKALSAMAVEQSAETIGFAVDVLVDSGFNDEAAILLKHIDQSEVSAGVHVACAAIATDAGDSTSAMTSLKAAITAASPMPDAALLSRMGRIMNLEQFSDLASWLINNRDASADQFLMLARLAEQIGAYRDAAVLAREVLQRFDQGGSDYLQACLIIATNCQFTGQFGRAEQAYMQLIAAEPGLRTAYNNLAYLYASSMGKYAEAEKLALEALSGAELPPQTRAAYMDTLALAQLGLGKLDEAEETLDNASNLGDSPAIKAHRALVMIERGDVLNGRTLLKESLSEALAAGRPPMEAETVVSAAHQAGIEVEPDSMLQVVRTYAAAGKFVKAQQMLTEPGLESMGRVQRDLLRGEVLLLVGRAHEAADCIRQAIADSSSPEQLMAASRLARKVSPALVLQATERLVVIDPGPASKDRVIRQMLVMRQFDDALAMSSDLLESDSTPMSLIGFIVARMASGKGPMPDSWPDPKDYPGLEVSPGGRFFLSVMRGDIEKALDQVRYVNVDSEITAADLVVVGAELCRRQGKAVAGLAGMMAEKALQMSPDSVDALRFSAQVAAMNGRLDDAIEAWHEVLTRAPIDSEAVRILGHSYVSEQRVDDLRRLLARYHLVYSANGWYHRLLGELAALQGLTNDATAAFRRAVEIDAEVASLVRLAMYLTDLGKPREAIEVLNRNKRVAGENPLSRAAHSCAAFAAELNDEGIEQAIMTLATLDRNRCDNVATVLDYLAGACPPSAVEDLFERMSSEAVSDQLSADFASTYFKTAQRLDSALLTRLYAGSTKNSAFRRALGLNLARAHLAAGDGSSAIALYRDLVQDYPQSPDVLERCAAIVLAAEGPARANAFAVRAVEMAEKQNDPLNLSRALETMGVIQRELDLVTPAHRSFARSVALETRASNLLHLAEVLADKGVWLGAEKELDRAEEMAAARVESVPSERVAALRKRIENRGREAGATDSGNSGHGDGEHKQD